VRVSVVIPTHNEAQAIGRVLADLPSDLVTEIIVVDSNSTDLTPEIAAKMGARAGRASMKHDQIHICLAKLTIA
jgi:glycosyltransferase involved in cell wall biosynthesis